MSLNSDRGMAALREVGETKRFTNNPNGLTVSRDGASTMSDHPRLTRDEKLVLLIEECGEVIQAATKCLRFGYDRNQPGYGVNSEVLSKEAGDLMGVIDALPLDCLLLNGCRHGKIKKAERIKAELASGDRSSPSKSSEVA